MRLVVAIVGLTVLTGCGEEKALFACVTSAERTILLRQMAAVGGTKAGFDRCIAVSASEKYCRALWLDADGEVHKCMDAAGFQYVETPRQEHCSGYTDYDDLYCYRAKWIGALPAEMHRLLVSKRPG